MGVVLWINSAGLRRLGALFAAGSLRGGVFGMVDSVECGYVVLGKIMVLGIVLCLV